jgi:hypothetical protein
MREAAIERHRFLNRTFEGSNPAMWALHMRVVKSVYGA